MTVEQRQCEEVTPVRDYQIASGDSHIETPPWVWAERLPQEFRERGPRHVVLPDGNDGWVMEGMAKPAPLLGAAVTGGQMYAEIRHDGFKYSDNLPGTGGPEQRL